MHFGMFSDVKIYDVAISGAHHRTYQAVRALYERSLSRKTRKLRSDLDNSDKRGVDCFECSTCFSFVQSGTVMNVAANIMSELILLLSRPKFTIQPISGLVRNRDRLVVVAKK
jgi:hypothetical protein